jgi:hypothetical protein
MTELQNRAMIDARTVYRLLAHIACDVIHGMRDGKTLAEIDEHDLEVLRKKDRIALYQYMVDLAYGGDEGDAIAAHLRSLKSKKRTPQPTPSSATVIAFRPEDRPVT